MSPHFGNKYEYTRTKADVVEEGQDILFVSAGITVEKTQQLGRTTRQQVEVVVSRINRYPLEEAPTKLVALKEDTVFYVLTATEFQLLIEQYDNGDDEFYLFKT